MVVVRQDLLSQTGWNAIVAAFLGLENFGDEFFEKLDEHRLCKLVHQALGLCKFHAGGEHAGLEIGSLHGKLPEHLGIDVLAWFSSFGLLFTDWLSHSYKGTWDGWVGQLRCGLCWHLCAHKVDELLALVIGLLVLADLP